MQLTVGRSMIVNDANWTFAGMLIGGVFIPAEKLDLSPAERLRICQGSNTIFELWIPRQEALL